MASPAENEAVVREALTYWGDRAVASNGTERGRVRIRGQFDQALAVLAALRAQAEAGEQAREALRKIDTESKYAGTTRQELGAIARAALTWGDRAVLSAREKGAK